MRQLFLVPLILIVAGCATGSASEPALVLRTYDVADIVSDSAEGPRISTADLAQNVHDAAGLSAEGEKVKFLGSGRIVARASTASHQRIEQVLADFRRLHPR